MWQPNRTTTARTITSFGGLLSARVLPMSPVCTHTEPRPQGSDHGPAGPPKVMRTPCGADTRVCGVETRLDGTSRRVSMLQPEGCATGRLQGSATTTAARIHIRGSASRRSRLGLVRSYPPVGRVFRPDAAIVRVSYLFVIILKLFAVGPRISNRNSNQCIHLKF